MNIMMMCILSLVFIFSLWFKRGESVSVYDGREGYEVLDKTPWVPSLRFAGLMTATIALQWLVWKMIL